MGGGEISGDLEAGLDLIYDDYRLAALDFGCLYDTD
jgi:hypothetical protein